MTSVPFERCYWVEPGRLLAGAYPADYVRLESRRRIAALLDCGIRTFVSLMEEREEGMDPPAAPRYAPLVHDLASARRIEATCLRHPIHDYSAPTRLRMQEILSTIDASLGADRPIYLHCWGGRGRTGTVVGVHLIREGRATTGDFLDVIAELRAGDPSAGRSPETASQIDFVRRY